MHQGKTYYFPLFLFFILFVENLSAQNTLQFNTIDSLFIYAEQNSAAIKTGNQQSLSAKWTKIAAIGNTINLKSPLSTSWTNNTVLPISYLPAEAFGGPAGTFKQVSLGQQYVINTAITPQIDIINPAAWARIKSADLNQQLVETNNLITKKTLFESIAAAYYNIIAIQSQIKKIEQSVNAADSIVYSMKNKFTQGIVREQELNNATINLLNLQDKLIQAQAALEQNYNSIKILCDLPDESEIVITETIQNIALVNTTTALPSHLYEKQFQLQSDFLKSELTTNRLTSFAPTLSLMFNQNWQQNSNKNFNDDNANHFSSQYVGLKISVPFPLDVNRLSTNYTSKINYNISSISRDHALLQNEINYKQLNLDYQKANSTYSTAKQISELKEKNYMSSVNQYNEGVISSDILLTAFNDKINAQLNYSAALAGLKYAESKININNSIQ
ncbi:MAG: TolC family protein [Bacteroidetes bacterium]|nr:TolC family protein [Bacteroidota bacterium]